MMDNGFEKILEVLQNINPENEDSDYAKNVRLHARIGIVYVGDEDLISYCPFYRAENPNDTKSLFTNDRSHYGHTKKCEKCLNFKKCIEKIESTFFDNLCTFCCEKNIKMDSICSKSFTKLISQINPFLKSVPRQKLRMHIFKLFERLKSDLSQSECGEFCSLLIDGSKRFKFNFYGFIVFSKNRLK